MEHIAAYQLLRKGQLSRVPAGLLGMHGSDRMCIAWLLDRDKEAEGFIWLKKKK